MGRDMAWHEWEYENKKVRADPEGGILLREEVYAETSPCAWQEPSSEDSPYGPVFALEACNAEILRLVRRNKELTAENCALRSSPGITVSRLEILFAQEEPPEEFCIAVTTIPLSGDYEPATQGWRWFREQFLHRPYP